MTLASGGTPSRPTVVLLAEPGAGRARRLALALETLGVATPETGADADPPSDETAEGPDEAAGEAPATPGVDIEALHEQVLEAANVRADDARPRAWADVAGAVTGEVESEVRAWLERAANGHDALLVTERRLHWLLPVLGRACDELDLRPGVVLAVRRPDLSADPQTGAPQTGRPGDIARAAAWLNQVLFTERASRDLPRVVVPDPEVTDDWVTVTARIGDRLDLEPVLDASATAVRSTQRALDQAPAAAEPTEQVALPPRLREQVDSVWGLLQRLVTDPDDAEAHEALDQARTAYVAYYAEADAVARSSARAVAARQAAAAQTAAAPDPAPAPLVTPPEEPPAAPEAPDPAPGEAQPGRRRRWWRRNPG